MPRLQSAGNIWRDGNIPVGIGVGHEVQRRQKGRSGEHIDTRIQSHFPKAAIDENGTETSFSEKSSKMTARKNAFSFFI
jgi:hypothetical protein